VTGRRITRLLGLLVVLLGIAIAPAASAGARNGVVAPAGRDAQASPVPRADDSVTSIAPRTGGSCGLAGRRADLDRVPMVADLVPGSRAAGTQPGGRVTAEPGRTLHESPTYGRCGRGPPAA
jgi:hypothetical protein